ncbi:hypothetical protein H8B13_20335 [Hymenobacter sp. BT188]|nr:MULTISPECIES: hypothetical protein [Hymenobacter]MBC6609178.1 hypothetical protein [Hymenobacter sp. BT188]QIL78195.1 hypothetical protein G7064_20420 [Hymenobacter sp. HDW8]
MAREFTGPGVGYATEVRQPPACFLGPEKQQQPAGTNTGWLLESQAG